MRFQVITAVVMATANILLSIALTARIGISGVVWGSVIAYSGVRAWSRWPSTCRGSSLGSIMPALLAASR